ncbi:MAG: NACHT domain-containing protein [Lachnospiraceae bacterium]|nr:NACHT domain-containing protein [Lachnospiraceae bacterium]
MELSSVLNVIVQHSDDLGLRQADLYMLLFEENGIDLTLDVTQTAKNVFNKGKNKRPLTQRITANIMFQEGGAKLRERIRTKWLSKVGRHKDIYDKLCNQILADEFLPDNLKEALISCCDPSNDDQLSHFIMLCIICGNYNTIQQKSNDPKVGEDYFNVYEFIEISDSYDKELALWQCSKREFLASCSKGGRFASLNIIQAILPKGYIVEPDFPARYIEADGSINSVMDICKSSTENIAIVGEGGIGKTTFFHQLMREEFLDKNGIGRKFRTGCPVTFFIELNRCPEQIKDWYNEVLGKTNFITRYIGQLYENHRALDIVDDKTLDMIEKEFQRTPEDHIPRYLLLLDGFNEVKSNDGFSVRTMLSNEISVLNTYPNIRIITTSRETQAAYYASDFKNVKLIGLEDGDIKTYFERSNIDETLIGLYMSNKPLLKCLRIPLFLCMFTAERVTDLIPETPGEILYQFFHRDSCFYNIRKHAADTRTNPFNSRQTSFVLDFILPYIGWRLEQNDSFSVNDTDLEILICNAILCIQNLCAGVKYMPFKDFDYRTQVLLQTAESLYKNGCVNVEDIIICIYGYLGILYQYQNITGDFNERNRYSFIHHHFRDYFSSIWDVQLLLLLQCINVGQFFQKNVKESLPESYHDFLNTYYWQHHKKEFVSQILMEHRNRPLLKQDTGNWYLPEAENDEQKVLEHVLDFCRELCTSGYDIHYLLQNVLSAILQGREELSSMNLGGLDFKYCSFFNVTCSKKGATETLSANFDGSKLYMENFQPEDHQNSVIDFLYHNMQCFTLDMNGQIKCWDVLSGKLEYELSSNDPMGIADFSPTGFMKISPNGKYLATKQQVSSAEGIHISIGLYDLSQPEKRCELLRPLEEHNKLNSFSFTGDSKGLLMVCDSKTIYIFSLYDHTVYGYCTCNELLSETQLYAEHIEAPIYGFTAEYNLYDWEYADDFYAEDNNDYNEDDNYEDDNYEDDDYEGDDDELPILCMLVKVSVMDSSLEVLYTYTGMPQTMPTAKYIPATESFLLFNYDIMQIEQFFCSNGKKRSLFEDLTKENDMPPNAIHVHPEHPDEFYFMYPSNCYLTSITASRFSVLMKYPISGINKLLTDSDQERELIFKTSVAPSNNRFIVGTDTNVYEWNAEEDTLILKYNIAYYNCTDLITDPEKSRFFLVHMYNGISVFGGSPLKLVNSYCFSDREYFIGCSCYEPSRQLMALNFSREDHEKIVLLNMSNGKQFICFSTIGKNESVCNMCFDNSGEWLLITTQYRCMEYQVSSGISHLILEPSDNERIANANYMGNYIEIALVEDWINSSNHVESRCEFYQRKRIKDEIYYRFSWGYVLPELTDDLFPYFVPRHGDLGITGAKYENGLQAYWVTQGFFLEREHLNIPFPECYKIEKNKRIFLPSPPVVLEFIFYKHEHAVSKYQNNEKGFSYVYLSDDLKKAIFLKNSCYIFVHDNYRKCTYEEIKQGFEKKIGGYDGNACWEFAIPWEESDIIASYENYQLMRLNADTGAELQQLEYTPGIAICGCSFSNIIAEPELKEELKINGGII